VPLRGLLAEVTVLALVVMFATTTLFQPFIIPSGSMEDTLLTGDHVLVDRLAYSPSGPVSRWLLPHHPVRRGDIVVFRSPVDPEQVLVKRAIGLPGDRLRFVNRALYVNGQRLEEPYVSHKQGPNSYRDNFPAVEPYPGVAPQALEMFEKHVRQGELEVPPGRYFFMGDNRDQSLDSRYWGLVPQENIIGQPLLVYWSYAATSEQLSAPGWSLTHLWDVLTHFPTKTRWARTGKLVRGTRIGAESR
jgi:signal peptidase I